MVKQNNSTLNKESANDINDKEKLLIAYQSNDFKTSILLCKKLLSSTTDNQNELLFLLGNLYINEQKYELALKPLFKLAKINPKHPNLHFQIGCCYLASKAPKKAASYLIKEINNSPDDIMSYNFLLELYVKGFDYFDISKMSQTLSKFKEKWDSHNNATFKKVTKLLHLLLSRYSRYPSAQRYKNRVKMLKFLPKHATVAEIGVQEGIFADHILTVTQPKKLTLIDCWDFQSNDIYRDPQSNFSQKFHDELYNTVIKKFKKPIKNNQVSIKRGYSIDMLYQFDDHTFDWVYIDANHSYKNVKEDLTICLKKVKKGGYICGHDYVSNQVQASFGVEKAVDELIQQKKVKMIALTEELYASFILQV